jgi:hypothetical protein
VESFFFKLRTYIIPKVKSVSESAHPVVFTRKLPCYCFNDVSWTHHAPSRDSQSHHFLFQHSFSRNFVVKLCKSLLTRITKESITNEACNRAYRLWIFSILRQYGDFKRTIFFYSKHLNPGLELVCYKLVSQKNLVIWRLRPSIPQSTSALLCW